MDNIKKYSAEIYAALAGLIATLLISLIPSLEPLRDSIVGILVIVFGLIFSTQVKKGLLGRAPSALLKVSDYWAEIITAVIGSVVMILVTLFPDFLPYQADLVTILVAVVFAILEVGFGYRKGLNR